jgi:hypothetical protein
VEEKGRFLKKAAQKLLLAKPVAPEIARAKPPRDDQVPPSAAQPRHACAAGNPVLTMLALGEPPRVGLHHEVDARGSPGWRLLNFRIIRNR